PVRVLVGRDGLVCSYASCALDADYRNEQLQKILGARSRRLAASLGVSPGTRASAQPDRVRRHAWGAIAVDTGRRRWDRQRCRARAPERTLAGLEEKRPR